MEKKNIIEEIQEKYELELEKIISEINNLKITRKSKSKLVLLQFPDGLKPYATAVADYLKVRINSPHHSSKSQMSERTNAEFLIWFGSCYGACDIPSLNKKLEKEIDLVVQFGHNNLMPNYS